MTFKTWLLFLAMETALSLSPGPAVFYVVSQGVRGALRRTLPAAGGNPRCQRHLLCTLGHEPRRDHCRQRAFFCGRQMGRRGLPHLLGIKALRSAKSTHAVDLSANPAARDGNLSGVYLGALTLQLANPKALLFFLALLPQFIDPSLPVVPQMLILAATSMVPEFCILTGYGWLAHRAAHSAAKFGVTGNMNRWLARIEGAGLLGCATLVLRFNRGST